MSPREGRYENIREENEHKRNPDNRSYQKLLASLSDVIGKVWKKMSRIREWERVERDREREWTKAKDKNRRGEEERERERERETE